MNCTVRFHRSLILGMALTLSFGLVSCTKKEKPPQTTEQPTSAATQAQTAGEGLKIEDLQAGTGAEAVAGKTVVVQYTGWLKDGGKKFDSSHDHGKPFSFQLGSGMVIKGWDQGVVGMKVGGKRKLTIPSALAYGPAGAGGGLIPPNADLVFEVELQGVE